MNESWTWFKLLVATFINGAAGAIAVVIVDPVAFNFTTEWKKTLLLAAVMGVIGAANYLKKSPLPGVDGSKLGTWLLVGVISFACLGASCKESSQYRKAAQALYDIDSGVATAQSIVEQLNKTALVDNDTYLLILESERSLLLTTKSLRTELIAAGEVGPLNRQKFIASLTGISNTLDTLQQEGVTRIKSDNAKLRFSVAITGIRTAAATLTIFLSNLKEPVPTTGLAR